MTELYYYSFEIKFFGVIYIASTNECTVFLNTEKKALIDYTKSLNANLTESYEKNAEAVEQVKEFFCGKRKVFTIKTAFLSGTDFQKRVWKEISGILYCQTKTYKEIALKIEHEKAYRAVGTAASLNPVPVIIPCHRLISSNGKIGGFSLGIERKKYLLELENTL